METIPLKIGDRTCRILIGKGLVGSTGKLISEHRPGQKFAIITNSKVNSLYGDQVAKGLDASGFEQLIIEVADSETSKSLDTAKRLYKELSENNFDRDSCIIGLGGGVVGDIAGFVAATYMRGIDLIHIPTTLLAQVDSAIGGKTGVNLPEGRNLIGAFHQPLMVISDIETLKTLPDEDFRSGLAEVVKYGVLAEPELFAKLETNLDDILGRDERTLTKTVTTCSSIKARVVEEDERDHGKRLMLNYGHTLGHALEAASGYTGYRHGGAVAIGMIFAAKLSVKLGLLKRTDLDRISAVISSLGLPECIGKRMDNEVLLKFMYIDKKNKGGKLRLVLPTGIGEAVVSDGAGPELVIATLEEMKQ
jgi:3-dehydroquinate synthase